MDLKLKLKAEVSKAVNFVKNGKAIRSQNKAGLFKSFKHVKYARIYYKYNHIKYLTISTI